MPSALEEELAATQQQLGRRHRELQDNNMPRTEFTRLAVLLPLTLQEPDAWQRLIDFLRSFSSAFTAKPGKSNPRQAGRPKYSFFVGVDLIPAEVEEEKAANHIADLVNRILSPFHSKFDFDIVTVPTAMTAKNKTIAFRDLARVAYESSDNCELFMLVTDDVRFKEPTARSFMSDINDAFGSIADTNGGIELGLVGCVAILDETLPSTPSIPIVHRHHLKMFRGELVPHHVQLDSHLEDLLFEIHFRFTAAKILKHSRATRIGYEHHRVRSAQRNHQWPEHVKDLVEAYRVAALQADRIDLSPSIALDIVVPSFRTPKQVIESIFKLPRAEGTLAVRIIVVCDNPHSKQAVEVFRELESDFEDDFAAKFRVNKENLGPGGTRGQGLLECVGDWVLFLDDDVIPEPALLYEYASIILRFPSAPGFIGRTALPLPENPRQFGMMRSRISFGWDFAENSKTDILWGLTANLCVRRSPQVTFDPVAFPRGGGGEDVDFCMRLSQHLHESKLTRMRHFVPAPLARVRHPWWDGGHPQLKHFISWARGDRPLIERFPWASFWNFPDCVETSGLLLLTGPVLVGMNRMKMSTFMALLIAQPLGEVLYEIASMRHLDLVKTRGPAFALETAWYSAIMSLCHEYGRFRGHVDRGWFFSSFCKQFNWYAGTNGFRSDFPFQERIRTLRRSFARWMTALCLVWIFKSKDVGVHLENLLLKTGPV